MEAAILTARWTLRWRNRKQFKEVSANRLGRFRVFLGLLVGVAISLALLATIMIVLVEKRGSA
jgi:hypothetical protein